MEVQGSHVTAVRHRARPPDQPPAHVAAPCASLFANAGSPAMMSMALSPSEVMRRCGLEPEPWQREELDAFHRRCLWNICRGGGKSTTASTLAAHELVFGRALHGMEPLVLAVAPSERQSRLLLRKVRAIFRKLGGVPPPLRDTMTELELGDGLMVALPATENIRGYQNVTLLLWDEFSRMPDETVSATTPMVAERGRIVGLSTPAGMRGEFHKLFTEERRFPEWRRVTITGEQSERISKRKLEEERRRMVPCVFNAEYMCSFTDSDSVLFPTEMTRAALTGEVEPLRADWPRFT